MTMTGTFYFRDLLLDEIHLAVRTASALILKIQKEHWSYKPRESMRSLLELTHHLIKLPASDLAILTEASSIAVARLENSSSDISVNQTLVSMMETNFETLNEYFNGLSEPEFAAKETKAFYDENRKSQAKWLVEINAHIYHHRAQLFNYLKQLDYPVSMFDLY